jgi:DNA primase
MVEFNLKNVSEYNIITKELILDSVFEYEIFEKYLNESVDLKKTYCSPFRIDKKPTCVFFKGKSDKLLFVDFGEESSVVDCFGFVCKMFGFSLPDALKLIATDFRLEIGIQNNKQFVVPRKYTITEKILKQEEKSLFVKTKKFTDSEIQYWKEFFITTNTTSIFNVFSTSRVYLDNKVIWTSREDDPIFTYYFKKQKKKKIYRPNGANGFKFLSSSNIGDIYQGEEQLPEGGGELLIITKSLKDVMVLYEMGYNAVAPNSESYDLSIDKLREWKEKFNKVVLFYDNDNPGLKAAHKLFVKHPDFIDGYIHIGCSYQEKDISDFIKEYKYEFAENYLIQLLKKIWK